MKIAMFFQYESTKGMYDNNMIHIFVFDISQGRIVSMEQEYLYSKDINSISLWLLSHKVEEMYVANVDQKTKEYFMRMGVSIKSYEELEDKDLFNEFLE